MELFSFLNIIKTIQIILKTIINKPFSSTMLMVSSLTVKVPLTEEASCGGSEISSKDKMSAADQL